MDLLNIERSPPAREPSRPETHEDRRPCVYSRPEGGPPVYLWWEAAEATGPDAGPDSKRFRLRSGGEWTGPGSFESSPLACQVLWGAEPLPEGTDGASPPWIDAATAAAIILDEERRSRGTPEANDADPARPLSVIVVGTSRVEAHTFRPAGDGGWLRGVVREGLRVDPIDAEDPSAWERIDIGGDRTAGATLIVAAPSLGDERWLDVWKRAVDIPALEPEPLYRAFAKTWIRHGGIDRPALAFDYRLTYQGARWGTLVPHRETIRSARANLRRVYRLAGGHPDDYSIAARVEWRPEGGSGDRRAMIPENRFAGLRDRIRSLEFEACPASGASRFIFRSEPRLPSQAQTPPIVFWPIADLAPIVEDPRAATAVPVAISLCLAVDARTAARAWLAVAPLVDRLRGRGRLARLQVVWSVPDPPYRTRGWSPQQLEAMGKPLRIGPPAADAPDVMACRGLSQAIREAMLLEGEAEGTGRPAVGLVIVDRDYDPGRDPAFRTVGSRWAWFLRMRRILGGPLALLAYQIGDPGGRPDLDLREVLGHLVILGRQANTTRTPVATLEERQLSDPDAAEAELEAILSVADRMGALAGPARDGGPGPAGPLCVIEFEGRGGARIGPPIAAGAEADPALSIEGESSR